MLAISSSREGMPGGGSTVYTLPLSGGEPRLITDDTPSYLHGWNPNIKVEVLDFAGPFEVFSVTTLENGEKPFLFGTVSEKGNLVYARNGLKVQPDYNFDNMPQFDILIILGDQVPGKRNQ